MIASPMPLEATARAWRWHGALVPLGVPTASGVRVWHPDHPGVEGVALPADARVPVDLAGEPVPLTWNTAGSVLGSGVLTVVGEVDAAWLADGALHVGGSLDLSVLGLAAMVADAAEAAELGDGHMRLSAVLTDLAHPALDDGVDYRTITGWRLKSVQLEPALAGAWPAPAGEVRWIKPGQADPSAIAHAARMNGEKARVRALDHSRDE